MAKKQEKIPADIGQNEPLGDYMARKMAAMLRGEDKVVDPEQEALDAAREKCRKGNPFPLIAIQWPELVIEDKREQEIFLASMRPERLERLTDSIVKACTDKDNPHLRLDYWQKIALAAFFDDTVAEIGEKGATKVGKGASTSMGVCLWYDVWSECKIVLTSQRFKHAQDVIYGETTRWFNRMKHKQAGRVTGDGVKDTSTHYITIANPESGEGFSGQHGPRTAFVFDESCHDDQTEVLTQHGWKLFADMVEGDYVMAMDTETHQAYMAKPRSIHASYREGEMWHYKGRGTDFCVTPNHKMYCSFRKKDGTYKPWELLPIENISRRPTRMMREVRWGGESPAMFVLPELRTDRKFYPAKAMPMDAWIEFLAWYFSEGHLGYQIGRAYSVGITQKCDKTRDRIANVIERIGFSPKRKDGASTPQIMVHSRQLAFYLEQFGKNCRVKRLPPFLRTLSKEMLKRFIAVYAEGDGYHTGGKLLWHDLRTVIYTSSPLMADDLQELAIKAGFQATLGTRKLAGVRSYIVDHWAESSCDGYVLGLSKAKFIEYRRKKIEKIQYSGMVYCVNVPPDHVFLTRRNGQVIWSGNSAIPDGFYDDAGKQARKILALANPRVLSGWFRGLYKPCTDPNVTQIVDGPFGKRLCMTIDGAEVMNVVERRLEKPIGPPGGIEIGGKRFEHNQAIPKYDFDRAKPLIPEQCDYGRHMGIRMHPDPNHVAVMAHGHFPKEDAMRQVILGSWIDRHTTFWKEHQDQIIVDSFGFDIARSLDGDGTCLSAGGKQGCKRTHKWKYADITFHVSEALRIAYNDYGIDLTLARNPVCVDMDGLGAGVGDQLRQKNVWVIEFRGNAASEFDPKTYINTRAEAYALLGRRLNPDDRWADEPWAIPYDTMLFEELTAPEKVFAANDALRFRISPKQPTPGHDAEKIISIREKIGRSPDTADSVVYLYHAARIKHNLDDWLRNFQDRKLLCYPTTPAESASIRKIVDETPKPKSEWDDVKFDWQHFAPKVETPKQEVKREPWWHRYTKD